MFDSLGSYDPSKLFERTANGIVINISELKRLNSEYKKSNVDGLEKKLSSLGDEYNRTRLELAKLEYGTDEYNNKLNYMTGLESQINETEQLMYQYRGLCSAYNEWQAAESAGSQRDMYESIITGFETVEDELSRGWLDDGTIEFLELLTGQDLSTASVEECMAAWNGLGQTIAHTTYTAKDFFTTNEDGESTNDGVYNFLDAIGQMEEEMFGGLDVVKRDGQGNIIGFDFSIVGGDKAIAEALGVSEELVQIMVRAADDAGFVVSMDGTYQQLQIVKEKGQEAANALVEMFKGTEQEITATFDLGSKDQTDIMRQYEDALSILNRFRNEDGTINFDMAGAEEAYTLASTLLTMVDQLSEPAYMSLDVSEVESEMQIPLAKLQEYERLTKQEHQLKLGGADTSKLEESKEEILDYFEQIQTTNPQLAAELKIEGLTRKELQQKLESGELSIPATIDLQVEMNNTLRDMVNIALHNAGLIDDEELRRRVNIELYAEEVDTSQPEKETSEAFDDMEEAVQESVNSDTNFSIPDIEEEVREAVNGDAEEPKVSIEAIISMTDNQNVREFLDVLLKTGMKPEHVEVVADLIDNEDVVGFLNTLDNAGLTPEQVKTIAELIDKGDVQGLIDYLTGENVNEETINTILELSDNDNVVAFMSVLADAGLNPEQIEVITRLRDDKNVKEFLTSMLNAGLQQNDVEVVTELTDDANVVKFLDILAKLGATPEQVKTIATLTDNEGVREFINSLIDSGASPEQITTILSLIDKNDVQGLIAYLNDEGFDQKTIDTIVNLTDNEDVKGLVQTLFDIGADPMLLKTILELIDNDNVMSFLEVYAKSKDKTITLTTKHVDKGNDSSSEDSEPDDEDEPIVSNEEEESSGNTVTTKYGASSTPKYTIDLPNPVEILRGVFFPTMAGASEEDELVVKQPVVVEPEGQVDTSPIEEDAGEATENTSSSLWFRPSLFVEAEKVDSSGVDEQVQRDLDLEGQAKTLLYSAGLAVKPEESNTSVIDLSSKDSIMELDDATIETFFAMPGLKDNIQDVESFKTFVEGLEDEEVDVLMKMPGFEGYFTDTETFRTMVEGLDDTTYETFIKPLGLETALSSASDFRTLVNQLDDSEIQVLMDILGVENGVVDVSNLSSTIEDVPDKTVEVGVDTIGQEEKVTGLQSAIDNLKGTTVTVTATVKKVASDVWGLITGGEDGGSGADGTAFAEGTAGRAFRNGDWGVKGSGTALVGELGQELVVRNGHFFTVGDNGAEFFQYKPNDIIFNAGQTKQLFEQGKITNGKTRGRAVASGTAFAEGNAFFGGFQQGDIEYAVFNSVNSAAGSIGANVYGDIEDAVKASVNSSVANAAPAVASAAATQIDTSGSVGDGGIGKSNTGSYSYGGGSGSGGGGGGSAAEEFLETIDWIEIAIDRIERAISSLDLKASSVFKKWSTRNEALVDQIDLVRDEIDLQQKAYDRYIQEANSVGLSEEYAAKVRNGEIDIEDITDESLKEQIDEYQEWYEKAIDCRDAVEELKEQVSELYAQRFDNIVTEFEGILSIAEHEKNMIEEYINQSEAQAWLVSSGYYEALIDYEKENQNTLIEQRERMLAQLNENVASGAIEVGSEEWVEEITAINDVTQAIEESNTQLLEYGQTLQELEWEKFDLLQDKISQITTESEFLIDLLSSDKLYEDNGQLTDSGMSTMGLHGVGYNVYMAQADLAAAEVARLDKELVEDPYDQDLIDRRQEMLELQQEMILAAQDEKEAIRDMVEEGIELELDALQELIDKRNEALDSQKDLYDYQKKVKEQTEEIAALEKQMAAYAGDDSEETRAKVQELKVSLEDGKQELEETEYDRYISDQEKLFDELYLEYETILNERLDNLELLITEMVALINGNSTVIGDNLTAKTEDVGYTLSESMKTIWNTDDFSNTQSSITNGSNVIKDAITMYGEKFSSAFTTTNDALKFISIDLASMIGQLNKIAKTNVKTAAQSNAAKSKEASGSAGSSSSTTNKPVNKPTTNTSGDGTPKIGDKVKFVSGQYFYDSYGKRPLGSHYLGKEVYITNINKKGSHPYHISTGTKLGSGDLGWLKLNQISGYATGKYNLLGNEFAWTQENGQEFIVRPSDGAILTPLAKGDSVLSAAASNNLWNMANNPADFIRDNLGIGDVDTAIGNGGNTSVEQNIGQVVFSLPNVKNYEQLLTEMQRDKNFERLILSMTVDQIAGKSPLTKGKSLR